MNAKDSYTIEEIKELRRLIALRVDADKSTQKRIRDKMRKIGFYGKKYFGITDCQVSDLERLVQDGTIKIIDGTTSSKSTVSKVLSQTTDIKGIPLCPKTNNILETADKCIEDKLIKGNFVSVNSLNDFTVPNVPGLYCIKLRKGILLPSKFGKIREDGIIYIGQASKSLNERFWKQELNHIGAATFFRSMGAILGYLPPKGSLEGKRTRNYKFSPEDTGSIRKWIRQSLLVNWIPFGTETMDDVEKKLISKYRPLVNIQHNPSASEALIAARNRCVDHARS